MLCAKCNRANADTAPYCAFCGQALRPSPPIVPPLNAPPPLSRPPAAAPVYPRPAPPPSSLCYVCGAGFAFGPRMCPRCGTPVGTFVNPDDATFSTYLPVGYLYTPSPGASGAASIPQVAASAGDPAGGWNWGAALLGPLWAIAHRVWWYVGAVAVLGLLWGILIVMALATPNSRLFDSDAVGLLTLLSLGMAFGLFLAMGARGNALAWKSGRYASLEACRQTQRVWALWALGVFGVGILLLLAVLLPLLFTAVATTS